MPLKFILNDRQCESCTAALDGTVKVRLGPFLPSRKQNAVIAAMEVLGSKLPFAANVMKARFGLRFQRVAPTTASFCTSVTARFRPKSAAERGGHPHQTLFIVLGPKQLFEKLKFNCRARLFLVRARSTTTRHGRGYEMLAHPFYFLRFGKKLGDLHIEFARTNQGHMRDTDYGKMLL